MVRLKNIVCTRRAGLFCGNNLRHLSCESRDDLGVLRIGIRGLCQVLGEIVELTCGLARSRLDLVGIGEAAGAELVDELPIALADRHRGSAAGLHHDRAADGLVVRLIAEQHGQKTGAVWPGVFGKLGTADVGKGREQVGETDGLFALTSGLHSTGPANNERHAMPGFPGVGLHASQASG